MIEIAVCDDEPFMAADVAAHLSEYMEKAKLAYQINTFSNGDALLKSDKQFDMLLLDIQMDKPNGMETARLLRERGCRGLLIFITVLKESVFDSFEVQAFDYLVKPLDKLRFHRTLGRALKSLGQQEGKNLVIQRGTACRIVPFSEIVYSEVYGRKIYLHLLNGETVDYYNRLDELEKCLDSRFFRCHRSYLVNLDYVNGHSKGAIMLSDGEKIPVSRLREQELTKELLIHMKERRF